MEIQDTLVYVSMIITVGISMIILTTVESFKNIFLTPQINYYDDSLYRYVEYHITHSGIILLPIYMFQYLNYKLRKYSWLKMLLYLNILVAIIMPLNFQIDSNYMYIAYPPEVNNPLIIGDWPYYILFWEVIVLMFTYSLYVISTRKKV